METKTISDKALLVIADYKHIPYFNNRRLGLRGGLAVHVGKGSPEEIREEIENIASLQKISLQAIDPQTLKKLLVDNDIGIDCSGLAYHVLDAECTSRGKGGLRGQLFFPNAENFFRKFRVRTQPAKNAGVATLAHERNSREINMKELRPGDMITMLGGKDGGERDHILVIHKVDYQGSLPFILYYTHAIAWPIDGEYGHGVRQGIIRITDIEKPIIFQEWLENEKTGEENYTLSRAQKSTTTLRRLLFL